VFRLFNSHISMKERGDFLTFLQNHSTPYTDNVIRDLLQIMMGTPEYQLC
jgi:hypothetical protein